MTNEEYKRRIAQIVNTYLAALAEYKIKSTIHRRYMKTVNLLDMTDAEDLAHRRKKDAYSLVCKIYQRELRTYEMEKEKLRSDANLKFDPEPYIAKIEKNESLMSTEEKIKISKSLGLTDEEIKKNLGEEYDEYIRRQKEEGAA